MKTLSKAVAIASLVSASALTAQVANAEVEYSADLATTYLWRGTDLGGTLFGAAADYSHDSGLYAGAWVGGGDLVQGNELDLYVGFAKDFGSVSVDAGVYTYVYNRGVDTDTGADVNGSAGEMSELVVSAGFADASVAYTTSLQDQDYTYITLGYSVAGADLTYGMSDDDGSKYAHFDISYGLTDELAITVSQPIEDTEGALDDTDTIVVMSYSLPIK